MCFLYGTCQLSEVSGVYNRNGDEVIGFMVILGAISKSVGLQAHLKIFRHYSMMVNNRGIRGGEVKKDLQLPRESK